MKLTKYHLLLLKIINANPNCSPHTIDRLFYQSRIDEGISMNEITTISWPLLMEDLKKENLVDKTERAITFKGINSLNTNNKN